MKKLHVYFIRNYKSTIRYTVILLFLLAGNTAVGQEYVEIGQLGYRYSPETSGSEDVDGRSVQGWRINAMAPLKISDHSYLLPGFRFWQYNIKPGEDLRLYFFQLGFQTTFNDTWSWQVLPLLRSGIAQGTSFSDGLQVGLLTVANQKRSDNFTLGYGIYTNQEEFGQLLTPIIAVDWIIDEHWRLFGNFPMFTTLSYKINDRWNAGLHYIGLVTSFKNQDTYIERQSLDFSLFAEYYLTKQLVAQLKLGYPVGRRYEVYDEDDKVDFSLSILRFGNERELLSTFDEANMFMTFNLLFRVKK